MLESYRGQPAGMTIGVCKLLRDWCDEMADAFVGFGYGNRRTRIPG